uniref:Gst6 n=1 Tax=Arundo donax TaxID=35708 RepID=A0A0A9EI51_ARUDO
MSEALALLF